MVARPLLLVLLLASPGWAQPANERVVLDGTECVVSTPRKGEIRVKCRKGDEEVEIGQREDPKTGKRWNLKRKSLLGLKYWSETEVKTEDFPRELDPVSSTAAETGTPAPPVAFDGLVTHDVGIYWTPKLEAVRGGPSGALALATLSVAIANQSYQNSGVPLQLRLRDARLVAFLESSASGTTAISTDLSRLQGKAVKDRDGNIDTALDEIHGYRDQFGIDIVTLLGEGYAAKGACGVAFQNASAATAFSVVDGSCATGRPSYPHEVGHNQGANHDPPNACGSATCSGYNYGHQFGALGTMMSYTGSRVRYFSSPLVIHPSNGLPTGIANARDNARRLRETMVAVAAFRPEVPVSGARPPSSMVRPQARP